MCEHGLTTDFIRTVRAFMSQFQHHNLQAAIHKVQSMRANIALI